ncbi:hypothetical protein L1887_25855 [Cichorium endivia]|nr:hypothetical protein L1887_25855 [Cichorium endivia]
MRCEEDNRESVVSIVREGKKEIQSKGKTDEEPTAGIVSADPKAPPVVCGVVSDESPPDCHLLRPPQTTSADRRSTPLCTTCPRDVRYVEYPLVGYMRFLSQDKTQPKPDVYVVERTHSLIIFRRRRIAHRLKSLSSRSLASSSPFLFFILLIKKPTSSSSSSSNDTPAS